MRALPEQPEAPEFRLEITAQPVDIDGLGHVSNISYVRWIQDVAVAHSSASGLDTAAYERLGAVFVVRKHEIDYLASSFEGERIVLVTQVASMRAASSVRKTRIVRVADGRELVRATTLWAYVAKDTGSPRRIPDEVRDAFNKPV